MRRAAPGFRALSARSLLTVGAVVGLVLSGGAPGSAHATTPRARPATRWTPFAHVGAVLDVTGPRQDGNLTVAAAGRLSLLRTGRTVMPFARGAGGYETAKGPEPYVALSTGAMADGAGCSFRPDDVYALEPKVRPGVIQVDALGQARRFVDLPSGVSPNGIVFDDVGRFGHRLLVSAAVPGGTAVYAVDCSGRVTTVNSRAPSFEGGIAVAPATFSAFAGDLVGPDEHTGRLIAVGPAGDAHLVVRSGLASGGDIGVESIGVIPPRLDGVSAYLADRRSPGNPHPGTDSILRLTGTQLARAGANPGDLLVATEGGAKSIIVRCSRTCSVRRIGDGPAVAHGEGHIVFAPSR